MTITINTSSNVVTSALGSFGYTSAANYYVPFGFTPGVSLGITDTATNTVTLSVTQNSLLHSIPGLPADQVTSIQSGTFSLAVSDYSNAGTPSNPPTVTATSFTDTGPLDSKNQSTYNPSTGTYSSAPYSPVAALATLHVTQPKIALVGNQLVETDMTITATDSAGGSATSVVKFLFTNPISFVYNQIPGLSTALHTGNPIFYLPVSNANDVSYQSKTGSTTITVTQTNVLHNDPTAPGGDQAVTVGPGALNFTPRGGDITNAPSFDATTGTLVATGSLSSPANGTNDPVDYPSGYAPHAYSPADIVNSLIFSPASSVKLSGSQYLETTFGVTVTDGLTGSSLTTSYVKDYSNPIHVSSYSSLYPSPVYGLPVTPFQYGSVFVSNNNSSGTITASISQVNFIHTNPGAADDQRIAVSAGVLSGNTTSATLTTNALGVTTISGSTADVNTVLSNLKFTPATVSLTGKQTLETDFTILASDSYGDFDTATRVFTEVQPTPITVTDVSIPQTTGTLVAGQTVVIKVVVSAPITVAGGTPTLTLNDGGTAIYDATSSVSQALMFKYTVSANDKVTKLAVSSLNANGSTIGGQYGAALNLSNGALYTPVNSGSIKVVGTPPVVTQPVTPSAPITPVTTAPASSVFRFFDSNSGTHFFTSSTDERNTLLGTRPDLVLETNGFGAVDASAPSAVSVFRFFDTIHGTQFITSSTSERDTVLATRPDLAFEAGDIFYEHGAKQAGDVAVYRFFDTKLGTHFYTGSQNEHDTIATPGGNGYRADLLSEGVAFYAPSGVFK